MSAFHALHTSASGLSAQRTRLDTIANNIANADTTRRSDGAPGPYRRQRVIFEPRENPVRFNVPLVEADTIGNEPGSGVRISSIQEQNGPVPSKYYRFEPGHPDAIKEGPWQGYVEYPDVDIVVEMVDMIDASRAYEANVTAIRDFKSMWAETLRIGQS